MADLVAKAKVLLEADTRGFHRDMDTAERKAHSAARGISTALKAGAVAGGAALVGLGLAFRDVAQDAADGQKQMAQTHAVLRSTGGVANTTAKQVADLAKRLSLMSGAQDDVIQSGANMLLTFTNIRNETGRGNDIFNQSTKVLLDMSTALGEDMPKAAIQLGKALNDPITGMSALRRVGVTFTDQQKAQVKAMVDSGHTMDAQKLILRELTREFGGSAKAAGQTFGGQLSILHQQLQNTAEQMLQFAGPALTSVISGINQALPHVFAFVASLADRLRPTVESVVRAVEARWPAIQAAFSAVVGFMQKYVVPVFQDLARIAGTAIERIAAVVQAHMPQIQNTFRNLGGVIQNLWAVAGPILRLLFEQVLPRVVGIAIGILDKLSGAFKFLSTVVRESISFILGMIDKFLGGVQAIVQAASHIPFVGGKFRGLADDIGRARDHVRNLQASINNMHGKNIALNVQIRYAAAGATAVGATVGTSGHGDGVVGQFWKAFGDGAASFIKSHPPTAPAAMGGFPTGPIPAGSAGSAPRSDVTPGLWDELAIARADHLGITSTYRPGAITSTGNPSLHGMWPAHAFDAAGPESSMRLFFNQMIGRPGLSEVIHSPYWWHPGSGVQRISAPSVMRDHFSHVHVGTQSGDGVVGAIGDGRVAAKKKPVPKKSPYKTAAPARAPVSPFKQTPVAKAEPFGNPAASLFAQGENAGGLQEAYQAYFQAVNVLRAAVNRAATARRRSELHGYLGVATTRMTVLLTRIMRGEGSADSGFGGGDIGGGGGVGGDGGFGGGDIGGVGTFTAGSAAEIVNQGGRVRANSQSDLNTSGGWGIIWDGPGTYVAVKVPSSTPGMGSDTVWMTEARYNSEYAGKMFGAGVIPDSGGGSFDTGGGGGTISQADIEADIQARIQQEAASVLGQRARMFTELASNIFTPGAGGLTPGTTPATVHQQITFLTQPTDPFPWLRKAAFAAGG